MTMEQQTTIQSELDVLGACSSAVEWVGARDLATAWSECGRSDWMHWLLMRVSADQASLVLIACDHADGVVRMATSAAAKNAVAVARGVVAGTHTKEQARAAADAAYAAGAADAAYAYAAAAAYAAADAAYAAGAADAYAAAADATAADADAYAAANAAADADAARRAQADTIRRHISAEQVVQLWSERP